MHSLRRCIKTLDPSFRWGDDNVERRESGKLALSVSPDTHLSVIPAKAGIQ